MNDIQEKWEDKLKRDGLSSIDHTYKGTTYVESERIGGQRTLQLNTSDDMLEGWLIVYDEHDTESDMAQQHTLALVSALPKPIRVLGEKKLEQEAKGECLTRSEAQTLRRLLSFFSWEKLNQKVKEAR